MVKDRQQKKEKNITRRKKERKKERKKINLWKLHTDEKKKQKKR